MMVVSSPSEVAASLGSALRAAGERHGLRVETSAIEVGGAPKEARAGGAAARHAGHYRARVELLGADSPGLVSMVAAFLAARRLNIQSMDSRVYSGEAAMRLRRPRGEPETGVSRGVQARAEGDLFCLSAVVACDEAPDFERLQAEAAALEGKHGVRLIIRPLAELGRWGSSELEESGPSPGPGRQDPSS